jgi:hypothetical protein
VRGIGTNDRPTVSSSNPLSSFSWTTKKSALGPSFSFLTDGTLWLSQWYGRQEDAQMQSPAEQQMVNGSETQLRVAEVLTSRNSVS